MSDNALLEIEGLEVVFRTRSGEVTVLHDIDLRVPFGETVCIVGESGSGKSVTALAVMGLVPSPNGFIRSGVIRFAGENLVEASAPRMRDIRGKQIAMIFQEPMTALNPVFTVGDQIIETLRLHKGLDRRSALQHATALLKTVGIPVPERRIREYPHQLSGGMRQRAMIAMALACHPQLLIADEPTTALDVTVQAQILDLLKDIQAQFGTSILLITHDMGVVADVADRVVVMYAGRKVEEGRAADVLSKPSHPYTRALISCIPELSDGSAPREKLMEIPGMVPSLISLRPGCPFAPRCAHAMARCIKTFPPNFTAGPDHISACWLLDREMAA